jgi:H+/Cl- antiporter ClcA
MAEPEAAAPDTDAILREPRFLVVLALAAVVGVVAAAAAWGFLELLHEMDHWVYDDLPDAFGYGSAPEWWPLPVLAIAGFVTAFAIDRLPGHGGHKPSEGLNPNPTMPVELPGVIVAALGTLGLGMVLGPEAPLIALGGGLGLLAVRLLRSDAPPDLASLVGAAGTFSAVSFLFGSPVIAAVLLIEATGLGGSKLRLILIPGLIAAGVGSLVSVGLGSWTGVDTSDIALEPPPLPAFARPDAVDFLWTIPLAAVVALGIFVIFSIARSAAPVMAPRPFWTLPLAGIAVGGLAIAFSEATDKGAHEVLYSGEQALTPLISDAGSWSLGALALLIVFKGAAYSLSLAGFRGGPVFPALFLSAAAGLMAAQLPGFEMTPAVGVCMGAAVVAVLRLPLSAVVLATLLTSESGLGAGPLIIVGVVVAYLVTNALPAWTPAGSR